MTRFALDEMLTAPIEETLDTVKKITLCFATNSLQQTDHYINSNNGEHRTAANKTKRNKQTTAECTTLMYEYQTNTRQGKKETAMASKKEKSYSKDYVREPNRQIVVMQPSCTCSASHLSSSTSSLIDHCVHRLVVHTCTPAPPHSLHLDINTTCNTNEAALAHRAVAAVDPLSIRMPSSVAEDSETVLPSTEEMRTAIAVDMQWLCVVRPALATHTPAHGTATVSWSTNSEK
ncbi:MAG TPA: hypothetical protein V6C97_24300 [Oculatellaceae cyanobacterium]